MVDLNRMINSSNKDAVQEYRTVIKKILTNGAILDAHDGQITAPYLHLGVHGMTDGHYGPYAVEIGTRHGSSCSPEVRDWFYNEVCALAEEILPGDTKIILDTHFYGDEAMCSHRLGDGHGYAGFGTNNNTFQIEISRTLREKHCSAK